MGQEEGTAIELSSDSEEEEEGLPSSVAPNVTDAATQPSSTRDSNAQARLRQPITGHKREREEGLWILD